MFSGGRNQLTLFLCSLFACFADFRKELIHGDCAVGNALDFTFNTGLECGRAAVIDRCPGYPGGTVYCFYELHLKLRLFPAHVAGLILGRHAYAVLPSILG